MLFAEKIAGDGGKVGALRRSNEILTSDVIASFAADLFEPTPDVSRSFLSPELLHFRPAI